MLLVGAFISIGWCFGNYWLIWPHKIPALLWNPSPRPCNEKVSGKFCLHDKKDYVTFLNNNIRLSVPEMELLHFEVAGS